MSNIITSKTRRSHSGMSDAQGKGGWQRPVNKRKFDAEFDRIFSKKEASHERGKKRT